MNLSVGSIGALMVMIVIALWIWRRGERPIRSGALKTALISMIVGIGLDTALPMVAFRSVGLHDHGEGCWTWGFLVLNAGVHALSLGAFVGFILTTIGPAPTKPEVKG